MNFFANVTEENVELVGPTQTPKALEDAVSKLLDVPAENITVDMTRMGGGFGRRLYTHFGVEAAAISKKAGTPIKLIYTREDDMEAGIYRPASKYKIKASIKDNKITGYQLVEACVNNNMYDVIPNNFPAGAIANYQVDNHKLESNITIGAWRAPYTNFLAFAVPKASPKNAVWGVGPAIDIPTGGDDEYTGSGTWKAGPAATEPSTTS